MNQLFFKSPVGVLKLTATAKALTAVQFVDNQKSTDTSSASEGVLENARNQLREYFSSNRESFDLPIQPEGTDFEQSVWQQLAGIPYGSTVTYAQIAGKLGDKNKVRAVGRANGCNPIPIIIPCHRVIGANNKLTGYAGGIKRKQWLLQHEGALLL